MSETITTTQQNRQENIRLNSNYTYNARKGSIIHINGSEYFLEHRLKDFIAILINHANDVVTRNELMDYVWKGVIVNDESITKAASDLRKFLTANDIHDLQLITIRKLGYKLEIHETARAKPKRNRALTRTLKFTGIALLVIVQLIILIRAIRY